MTRLIAYTGDPMASLAFYACECGMYFKAVQTRSANGSTCRCECGRVVVFHGQVVSLWNARKLNSLFGTGWTEIPVAETREAPADNPPAHLPVPEVTLLCRSLVSGANDTSRSRFLSGGLRSLV